MTVSAATFCRRPGPGFAQVRAELGRGRKATHWIWFVFPQLEGLGRSRLSARIRDSFAAGSPGLSGPSGSRTPFRECARLVNGIEGRSIDEIFGYPDNLKFRSCMTLFAHVSPDNQVFKTALTKYFAGEDDPATIERLPRSG